MHQLWWGRGTWGRRGLRAVAQARGGRREADPECRGWCLVGSSASELLGRSQVLSIPEKASHSPETEFPYL